MLMNKRGQIGPQGLEDLPMSVMAFMTAIVAIMLFVSLVSSHLIESGADDKHKAGKRIAESLSGEIFKSGYSRSYGDLVLDGRLIQKVSSENPNLTDDIGHIEYGFWAGVYAGDEHWEFGGNPIEDSLSYSVPVTVLSNDSLKNGRIEVKIWKK